MNLQVEFLKRLKNIILAKHLASVLESFNAIKPISLRTNTLKINTEDLVKKLDGIGITLKPIENFKDAFTIPAEQRDALTHSDPFLKGECYIQSLASMLVPMVLDPQSGEEILDLTAAPGSKTTQIACLMNNTGRIAAVEKVKSRFFKLKNNCERQGATRVDFYCKDGALVCRSCPNRFDRVLLDAPCSSEGRFNTNDPKSFQYWNEKKIRDMAHKQWKLLHSAFQSLKPGGILVYSTCTFSPEENEAQIAKLIKKFGDAVQIEPISLPIDNTQPGLTAWNNKPFPDALKNTIRILPNNLMDGFFIARLRKIDIVESVVKKISSDAAARKTEN